MRFELRIASGDWEWYKDTLAQFKIDEDRDPIYNRTWKVIDFLDAEELVEFGKAISEKYDVSIIIDFKDKYIYIYDDYLE